MAEKRAAKRELIDALEITGFTSMDHMTLISRSGQIVEASTRGFRIQLKHSDLVPKMLKESLTLEMIEGDQIILFVPAMNLELSGRIARTRLVGKKTFEIFIDYSDDAPEYWRECLVDLLPRPGEMD